jgi:hypothetical protein
MKRKQLPRLILPLALGWLWLQAGRAFAQADEESMGGGDFIENTIVGRPLALRVRAESQITEDNDELISDDPNYARFPTRLYTAETKLFSRDRSTASLSYSRWESDQDRTVAQWAGKTWLPLTAAGAQRESHVTLGFRMRDEEDSADNRDYLYVGIDRSSGGGLYSYLQYRHTSSDSESVGHELYEYVSWRPTGKLRIGEQASVSRNDGMDDLGPWYVSLFSTVFLRPEQTSLRAEARYYDSGSDLTYQRYNVYLYQRIGDRSFVRLGYRFYDDSEGLNSNAYGLKFKRYFSSRVAAHLGYRYYDHSEGVDFDTFYGGIEVLL